MSPINDDQGDKPTELRDDPKLAETSVNPVLAESDTETRDDAEPVVVEGIEAEASEPVAVEPIPAQPILAESPSEASAQPQAAAGPQGVSILVPTYGRTAFLAESIECFKRQTYAGPLEMVIINDCPRQVLSCDVPGVRVYNLPTFPDLAAKRNALAKLATYDLFHFWDDDDIYLPDHIAAIMYTMTPEDPADRSAFVCFDDGKTLRTLTGSGMHETIIRRSSFEFLRGFRSQVASDVDLVNRGIQFGWYRGPRFHNVNCETPPTSIFRADAGRVHMESQGRERQRITEADYRGRMDVRIRKKEEPGGEVVIVPKWREDYIAKALTAEPPRAQSCALPG